MARLDLTGERTAPGWAHEQYWFARHEAVYRWLIGQSRSIADIGSGEGFGAELLQASGADVVAVELDQAACRHSRSTYPGVPIICANAVQLPLRSASVDLVVSCQTIEHIWDPRTYVRELRRVTQRGVVITTPNRLTFSPGLHRGGKPTNPFHVEEFDAEQMFNFLRDWPHKEILGLHHGSRISNWEHENGSIVEQLVASAIADTWPQSLLTFQSTITSRDFLIDQIVDGACDLIAVGHDR